MASNGTVSNSREQEEASAPKPDEPPPSFAQLLKEKFDRKKLTPKGSIHSLLGDHGKLRKRTHSALSERAQSTGDSATECKNPKQERKRRYMLRSDKRAQNHTRAPPRRYWDDELEIEPEGLGDSSDEVVRKGSQPKKRSPPALEKATLELKFTYSDSESGTVRYDVLKSLKEAFAVSQPR